MLGRGELQVHGLLVLMMRWRRVAGAWELLRHTLPSLRIVGMLSMHAHGAPTGDEQMPGVWSTR